MTTDYLVYCGRCQGLAFVDTMLKEPTRDGLKAIRGYFIHGRAIPSIECELQGLDVSYL